MLYELIAVVRQGNIAEVKEIARTAGTIVLNSGGVIRGFTNWGVFLLTGPTHKHQARHDRGHHFIMRFDSSVEGQYAVRKLLSLDPRMVRFSVVKLGTTLQEIKDIGGTVDWKMGDSAFR